MAQALPLAKLATLMVKTLAKPVSKRIKRDFSKYKPTRRVLVGIGQTSHSLTSRMTIWSEGFTVRRIAPLADDKALSRGADFVGEGFILMVSMGTVTWEYFRSNEKAKKKEAAHRAKAKAERDALQANFKALDERLRAVEEVVQYNSQSILNISGKRYVEPAEKKQLVDIPGAGEDEQQDNPVEEKPMQKQKATNSGKPWWKLW